MLKSCLGATIMLLVLSAVSLAPAQDLPQVEVFGGYSFLRNPESGRGFSASGWSTSFTDNASRWFGLETSLSDHYGIPTPTLASYHKPGLTFLVGPRLSYRSERRVTPFTHALFGGVRGRAPGLPGPLGLAGPGPLIGGILCRTSSCPSFSTKQPSETAFALALGAGIDLKVSQRVAIRLLQADYVRMGFPQADRPNDARVATGIVFTLGKRSRPAVF